MVETIIPKTLQEVLEVLNQSPATLIAGGTDLMVKKRSWSQVAPSFVGKVILISGINELDYVKKDSEGIHIGSLTTLESLIKHDLTPKLLKKAIMQMASPAIRHSGTIGGNIGNASPAGDSLPVLYVLNTKIVLSSIEGERVVAIEDFIVGPGKINKNSNELIKEIIIENIEFDFISFEKVGGRKSDAISKVAFCGAFSLDDQKVIKEFRVAFGAVGPTVIRKEMLEEKIVSKSINEDGEAIKLIVKEFRDYIRPIDDQRSTAVYRKKCTINIFEDFVDTMLRY